VTSLLVALFCIELMFTPNRSLRPLYGLAATAYASILLYAAFDRRLGDRPLHAAIQVAGDTLLVAILVIVTGGGMSPLSFLFALPVMIAAALMGLRGGMTAAIGTWGVYALLLAQVVWDERAPQLQLGHVLYAAVSHLVGLVVLGALGGLLADRLRHADLELQRRDEDLERLRALHADIVSSISAGIITTDGEGQITFVNRAAREIIESESGELLGTSGEQLFGLPAGFIREAGAETQAGRRSRFERRWRRPSDGDVRWLGLSFSQLRGSDGVVEGWLIVFQDLTEIASLEEQVRISERMAALGEMAAGMAHELRNPLAAISGCVQILGKHADAEGRRLSEIAIRESERLNRIIRDFLEFARPGECRPRAVDLIPLLEELIRLLQKSPELQATHRIELVHASSESWAQVDPDRMRQVFWNLSTNALKAMPSGGSLTIQVSKYGTDRMLISFKDEGQGMDDDTLRRYFQPFHSKFTEGSGLGAAIVYRIAQEHGGSVQVLSREGRGTEVRLFLARAEAPIVAELAKAVSWR
jgi:two-component system sensor histidine kinase PilS (NtrC family)